MDSVGHRAPQASQQANPQPGEILHRKRSQGLWPVSGHGALQGLERDSQPDAKGEMDALSSSHFKKAGLPLPYLGNFERRLEKGTKHMLGGRGCSQASSCQRISQLNNSTKLEQMWRGELQGIHSWEQQES